jgi:hypothetical protein
MPSPAGAWDYSGHRIVGAVADAVLQQHYKATYQHVRRLLEKRDASGAEQRSLSQVAVFPDCAKDEEEFCGRKPSAEEIAYVLRNLVHKSFHYTNSPLGQKTYRPDGVGAGDTDVVHMIAYTINQLRGNRSPKQDVKLTDTEALWLLTHLVGDIHQPLHVGQAYYDDKTCMTFVNPNDPADKGKGWVSTFGGNSIKFTPPPPAVPVVPGLHIYWDSTTVTRAMIADGYVEAEHAFAKTLAAKAPDKWQTDGDPATWAEKWFVDSMSLAQQAYTRQDIKIEGKLDKDHGCQWTVTLDESYEKWAQGVARDQLRLAGFRLAALLVAIFPQ